MLHKALSTFPLLTTERLTLRQLRDTDVEEIFSLRSDPTINQFLDRPPCKSAEDALNFIKAIQQNESLYWAITQTPHEKLIGTICLYNFSDELNSCEIGYELLANYQGQGIMLEAAKSIIAFAVQTLGIKTLEAFTHKENKSSTNLLLKCSFVKTDFVDDTDANLNLFRLSK